VFNLRHFLSLSAPAFWKGSFWQLLTHPFLPASFTDLLVNLFLLITLGPRLEQNWSRNQFLSFCLISALGAGLAKILFAAHSPIPFAGFSGIIFGLLVAWLKLFGREEISLFGVWKMSVRRAFLIAIAYSLLLGFIQSVGRISFDIFVPLGGGVAGWVYLTLRWKRNLAEPAKINASDRIARLEL
ncbi:MAG: rhomboid family intramembrane serine protease, partial [Limisphaerales bacterium]